MSPLLNTRVPPSLSINLECARYICRRPRQGFNLQRGIIFKIKFDTVRTSIPPLPGDPTLAHAWGGESVQSNREACIRFTSGSLSSRFAGPQREQWKNNAATMGWGHWDAAMGRNDACVFFGSSVGHFLDLVIWRTPAVGWLAG